MVDSTESRLQRLEDIEAVKQLQHKYGYCTDSKQYEMLIDLFADDAVAEYSGNVGIYRGKEEIASFFRNWEAVRSVWSAHMMLNPVVEVEGDWASGIFYYWGLSMGGPPEKRTAMLTHGRYDNVYQRIGGKWFIKRLRLVHNFRTPYEEGWHKVGFMGSLMPGQPQRPPGQPERPPAEWTPIPMGKAQR